MKNTLFCVAVIKKKEAFEKLRRMDNSIDLLKI
jgi:hypothetical protein